jgi:TolB protein
MKIFSILLFIHISALAIYCQDAVLRATDHGETRLPLGYVGFTTDSPGSRPLPVRVGKVIADDLEFSGRVRIVEAPKFDSASRAYFMLNEAYAYIHGTYQFSGTQIILQCYLRDVETQELIYGKRYVAGQAQLRLAAHKFSDELVYQLFGEKGIAQTKILFVHKQGRAKEIYSIDYDGANSEPLTNDKTQSLFPCWLRGNSSIMFTSYKLGTPQLFIKDIPTGKESVFLRSKYLNYLPDYNSIDGEVVYSSSVDGNFEIFRISNSKGNPVRLTFSRAIDTDPNWSPNGYEIVFISDRSGRRMLYVFDRDGSNIRRLTYEGKANESPSWSPRGDKIAFCSMKSNSQYDIYTISVEGGPMTQLTFESGSNESPNWSPDGRHIVFTSTRSGRNELYTMREDGSNQRQLTHFGNNTTAQWSHFLQE